MSMDELLNGKNLREILHLVVNSYQDMNSEPRMNMFYKVIMAERGFNSEAASIMVEETKTMIQATKLLFYALQAKKIACFENPDASALAFAMTVHSIMDYEFDLEQLGQGDDRKMMYDFIEHFCDKYDMCNK